MESKAKAGVASIFDVALREGSLPAVKAIYEQAGYQYPDGSSIQHAPYDYSYYYYPSLYYYPYNYQGYSGSTTEDSHTFSYSPEYRLMVENRFGQSIDQSGWKNKDEVVTLGTPAKIEKSNVERSIFKAWNIDGSETASNAVTLTMDKPHTAKTIYQNQYYLEVKSELGYPQGSGWYDEGSAATVSVSPEFSVSGIWGSLGARNVFERWSGMVAGDPLSPITKVTVDAPMTLVAIWRQDYSAANTLLAMLIVAILILIALAFIAFMRGLPRLGKKSPALETLSLRYSKGEVTREEYLNMKKDLEPQ